MQFNGCVCVCAIMAILQSDIVFKWDFKQIR